MAAADAKPAAKGPLDDAEFQLLRRSIIEEDDARESLIKKSRDVLKCSKQAIYALQRSDAARKDAPCIGFPRQTAPAHQKLDRHRQAAADGLICTRKTISGRPPYRRCSFASFCLLL
jgi:hypothetical protein